MKVALAFSRLDSLMIKTASDLALSAFCVCLVTAMMASFPVTTTAAPVPQTEDMDRSELEKMIMEKIKQKKAENEANNKSSGSSKSTSSRSTPIRSRTTSRPTSPRVNSTRPSSSTSKTVESEGGGGIPRAEPQVGEAEFTEHTEMRGSINRNVDPNVKIRFNFEEEEWKDVIQFFADQAGFGVYYGQTGPPQGTLTYADVVERSIIEGLDFLNSRLSILQPPHVLVRNGNQLVLVNESMPYPEQLIAMITPDQLRDFGEYEVASCEFSLGKLTNGNKLALELREEVSEVHLDGFAYLESTNTLNVRERVRVLRRFYNQIKSILDDNSKKITELFPLKSLDAESLLDIARPLLGIADKTSGFEDGSLNFSVDPLGTTIYLRGTPDRISEFKELANKIDTLASDSDALVEPPYFQTHRISGGDQEVVFQILQNLLDGEPNIKMDQDTNNGNVYLEAPKRIHDKVTDFLGNLNPGDSFKVIPLKNMDPSDAKLKIEELLGIDGFDPPEGSPRIVTDTELNDLMVYGTPSQIIQIENIVAEIDSAFTSSSDGIRRPVRMIPMSPRRQEEVMKALKIDGIMELKGRKNLLNIIMPDERDKPQSGIRYERLRGTPQTDERRDEPRSGSSTRTTTSVFKPDRQYYVGTDGPRQENEATLGKTSAPEAFDESATDTSSNYTPAEEVPSVPGAPIEVQMTDRGLVIKSYDLDAADDLEDLITELFDPDSEWQRPTVIPLEHREVEEAKSILNYFLGLESSSSGGGGGLGGIGNLVGGAVKNAVGGAAGDALSGFLGMGAGPDLPDSAGAIELEGEDVRISTDIRFNTLIVTGATGNDIDVILELVEYIDQPGPPQKPKTLGRTYPIEIRYRDPMEIKDLVQAQLPDYFRQVSTNAGGNQQNARQQLENQVARQLQAAIQGGGRGNRRGGNAGGSNNSSERPKATLGVDETRRLLLVTGPEFIYEEVLDLVSQLDQLDNVRTELVETGPFAASNLANLLRETLGDSVEITTQSEMDEAAAGGNAASRGMGANTRGNSTRGNTGPGNTNRGATGRSTGGRTNPANLQREIMNAVRGNRGGGRNR